MKKMKRLILCLLPCALLLSMFMPMVVLADDASSEDSVCTVELYLKGIDDEAVTDVTIELRAKDDKDKNILQTGYGVSFSKDNGWKTEINLKPGTYTVKFYAATNRRTVELATNTIVVPEAGRISATLEAKKVVNDNFLPKFFRNNSFTLILLAVSGSVYYILRRRRLERTGGQ